jgi:hypothetical protein
MGTLRGHGDTVAVACQRPRPRSDARAVPINRRHRRTILDLSLIYLLAAIDSVAIEDGESS